MKQYVIIVAGGSGSRMQSTLPKQFITVGGEPVLMHTIKRFYEFSSSINVILVLPAAEIATWEQLCIQHQFSVPVTIAVGGSTRTASVINGLALIDDTEALVAIHDGVRPFVNIQIIENSFALAAQKGSAVVAVALKDSIRKVDGDDSEAVDRHQYRLVQTPQVFKVSLIKRAYQLANGKEFTDDASVAEAAGNKIYLVDGSYQNIKITTPEDLVIAEAFLKLNNS